MLVHFKYILTILKLSLPEHWSILSKAAGWANQRCGQIRQRLDIRFVSFKVLYMLKRMCKNDVIKVRMCVLTLWLTSLFVDLYKHNHI